MEPAALAAKTVPEDSGRRGRLGTSWPLAKADQERFVSFQPQVPPRGSRWGEKLPGWQHQPGGKGEKRGAFLQRERTVTER